MQNSLPRASARPGQAIKVTSIAAYVVQRIENTTWRIESRQADLAEKARVNYEL